MKEIKHLTLHYSPIEAPSQFSTRPPYSQGRTFDILPYVRDLHANTWNRTSHPHDTKDPAETHTNRLWLEARAAAHFYPSADQPSGCREQYSTWTLEWLKGLYEEDRISWGSAFWGGHTTDKMTQQPVPRSFEELFEIVEGQARVREEHRWQES